MSNLNTSSLRGNSDGRGDGLPEQSSQVPLIIISQDSDPDNVTVIPRPISEEGAELEIMKAFSLKPSDFKNLVIKRRTHTSDGRVVWAHLPAEHWATVVQNGDELRVFIVSDRPSSVPGASTLQWDCIPATVVYGKWVRVMLLSDTYKETRDRIYHRMRNKLPSNSGIEYMRLRLIFKGVEGKTTSAIFHQVAEDTEDDWRALLVRLYRDWGSLTVKVVDLFNEAAQ